jgi:hypothetical protein
MKSDASARRKRDAGVISMDRLSSIDRIVLEAVTEIRSSYPHRRIHAWVIRGALRIVARRTQERIRAGTLAYRDVTHLLAEMEGRRP